MSFLPNDFRKILEMEAMSIIIHWLQVFIRKYLIDLFFKGKRKHFLHKLLANKDLLLRQTLNHSITDKGIS